MKTGFKDSLEVKEDKKMKSPWNFDCPPYDERTSCYVNAGSHYGVGHKQPVGHHGNPKNVVETLPRSRAKVNTMRDDEVPHKNLTFEVEI